MNPPRVRAQGDSMFSDGEESSTSQDSAEVRAPNGTLPQHDRGNWIRRQGSNISAALKGCTRSESSGIPVPKNVGDGVTVEEADPASPLSKERMADTSQIDDFLDICKNEMQSNEGAKADKELQKVVRALQELVEPPEGRPRPILDKEIMEHEATALMAQFAKLLRPHKPRGNPPPLPPRSADQGNQSHKQDPAVNSNAPVESQEKKNDSHDLNNAPTLDDEIPRTHPESPSVPEDDVNAGRGELIQDCRNLLEEARNMLGNKFVNGEKLEHLILNLQNLERISGNENKPVKQVREFLDKVVNDYNNDDDKSDFGSDVSHDPDGWSSVLEHNYEFIAGDNAADGGIDEQTERGHGNTGMDANSGLSAGADGAQAPTSPLAELPPQSRSTGTPGGIASVNNRPATEIQQADGTETNGMGGQAHSSYSVAGHAFRSSEHGGPDLTRAPAQPLNETGPAAPHLGHSQAYPYPQQSGSPDGDMAQIRQSRGTIYSQLRAAELLQPSVPLGTDARHNYDEEVYRLRHLFQEAKRQEISLADRMTAAAGGGWPIDLREISANAQAAKLREQNAVATLVRSQQFAFGAGLGRSQTYSNLSAGRNDAANVITVEARDAHTEEPAPRQTPANHTEQNHQSASNSAQTGTPRPMRPEPVPLSAETTPPRSGNTRSPDAPASDNANSSQPQNTSTRATPNASPLNRPERPTSQTSSGSNQTMANTPPTDAAGNESSIIQSILDLAHQTRVYFERFIEACGEVLNMAQANLNQQQRQNGGQQSPQTRPQSPRVQPAIGTQTGNFGLPPRNIGSPTNNSSGASNTAPNQAVADDNDDDPGEREATGWWGRMGRLGQNILSGLQSAAHSATSAPDPRSTTSAAAAVSTSGSQQANRNAEPASRARPE